MEDALLKAEDMKRHAYLIMAHNEFHMLKKLLEELDDERNDIYIHIDRKTRYVDEAQISSWVKKSAVFFIPRMRIYWGHISIVKCELHLLRAAVKGNYHYYHLLSGVDFPLKSRDEIHSYFENENSEFLRYHLDGEEGDSFLYKVKYYFPLLKTVGRGGHDGAGKRQKFLRKMGEWQWKLMKCQERCGIDRTAKDKSTVIYKGTQWFSITHDFAVYILSKESEILRKYWLTNTPDEFFVATLAMNSEFSGRVKNNDLREIDWKRGCPYEYSAEDLDLLLATKALWARKISFNRSPELVKALSEHIHPATRKKEYPLISIIVPCYNVGRYLSECVDSLVGQSYPDLEILLIDDGSTDNTAEMAGKLAAENENVIYHRRENGGLSAARNTGIELSKGEYIAFVDSDDWVEKDYIEKLYKALSRWDTEIAVCGFTREDKEKTDVCFDRTGIVSSHAAMKVLGDIYPKENLLLVIAWNKLFKKSLFDNIRFPEGRIHEDEFIAHRIISRTDAITVITDPLYHYRIREGSIMSAEKKQDLRHLDYVDAMYDRLEGCRNMFFGDLLVYMLYAYFEEMKWLIVRYSEETIKDNDLKTFFRKRAAYVYFRYFSATDSYLKKRYLKFIHSPIKFRNEVIRDEIETGRNTQNESPS